MIGYLDIGVVCLETVEPRVAYQTLWLIHHQCSRSILWNGHEIIFMNIYSQITSCTDITINLWPGCIGIFLPFM